MEASYHLWDLPPGLYQLYPNSADLVHRLRLLLEQRGCTFMVFPLEMSSYLVADSIDREAAFDFENQGLTNGRLDSEVNRIIRESPFAGRQQQSTSTLSGGEEQLLSLTVALQQPHEFLIGQHCFDFLSDRNIQITHEHLLKHGKRMLDITYQACRTSLDQTVWELKGDRLIMRPAESWSCEFPDWSSVVTPWRLVARAVEKQYRSSAFRLRISQLTLDQVRCLGIAGDNGSGKSTFAGCLAGLLPYKGQLKAELASVASPQVGYLLQQGRAATQGLSADDIIQRFISQGRLNSQQGEYLTQTLAELSAYQALAELDVHLGCRLVIIAALLYGDYDIVILDEPTYRLPVQGVAEFLTQAAKVFGAKPSVIISHDPTFLSHFSDAIIQLDNGAILERPIGSYLHR